ncbi:hypothetical protein C8J57DRAFT_1260071 [Mycena rebaudengoi]|nr:hypothetical protein C8J57DRAFT_1260071 [Mycena rebaudengoi]
MHLNLAKYVGTIEQATLAFLLGEKVVTDLEAALATARGFRQYADEARLFGHLDSTITEKATAVLSLASELRDIMQPVENMTPARSTADNNKNGQQSPTTFAEAVKAQQERAPPRALRASKPKRPTSAPNRTATKPRQRTAPSTRLIVDLAGSRPTKKPQPVRVDFIEEEDARRFLREGIFLFGSHCRATRYRPRAISGGWPSGGN